MVLCRDLTITVLNKLTLFVMEKTAHSGWIYISAYHKKACVIKYCKDVIRAVRLVIYLTSVDKKISWEWPLFAD